MSRPLLISCVDFINTSSRHCTTFAMGSRFSKVMQRYHVTAAAASPTRHHQKSQLPQGQHNALTCEIPTSVQPNLLSPASNTDLMDLDRPSQSSSSPRTSLGLDRTEESPIDVLDNEPILGASGSSSAASVLNLMRELPGPLKDSTLVPEPEKICIICAEHIPRDQKAIEPCCQGNYYCVSCLKHMFLAACKDISRMPPKCCGMISIHHVRPYLSELEFDLFKSKFEERYTRSPFYCPVQQCSAFIPPRLLPRPNSNKGKERMDSVVGTPSSPTLSCPQCEADICTECRSLAHLGAPCAPFKFGLDEQTAKLLKAWGYKRCPMCGEGVKRMFGCNHMLCRCGTHFCWHCLGPPDDCDDESDDEDYQADDEISADVAHGVDDSQNEGNQTARFINLDGGGEDHWVDSGAWFGDEPSNTEVPEIGMCKHYFNDVQILLKGSVFETPTNPMVCMRCWRDIHPEIRLSFSFGLPIQMVPAGASTSLVDEQHHARRPHNRAREHRRIEHAPQLKRELSGYAASVPDLTAPLVDQPLTMLPPGHTNNDWFSIPTGCVVDTYGNIITTDTTPELPRKRRRYSLHNPSNLNELNLVQSNTQHTSLTPASHLPTQGKAAAKALPPASPFSLAYSCGSCNLIVCNLCREDLETARDKKDEELDEEDEERQDHFGLANRRDVGKLPVEAVTNGDENEGASEMEKVEARRRLEVLYLRALIEERKERR